MTFLRAGSQHSYSGNFPKNGMHPVYGYCSRLHPRHLQFRASRCAHATETNIVWRIDPPRSYAREFSAALEDPAARADLERGNLQGAAAAAARAVGAWRARALEWLAEDVRLRRRRIAELEERLEVEGSGALRRQREALLESIERVRTRDPDFAALRDDPAFQQLFSAG